MANIALRDRLLQLLDRHPASVTPRLTVDEAAYRAVGYDVQQPDISRDLFEAASNIRKGPVIGPFSKMVRKGGFEPPRSCERQPLKLVRLPVPPLPRLEGCRCERPHERAAANVQF
jgi:hypothetical protein